jgi:hypothetical protein
MLLEAYFIAFAARRDWPDNSANCTGRCKNEGRIHQFVKDSRHAKRKHERAEDSARRL